MHLPKGAYITNADGKPVYRLGITPIPVKRTPIPMPVDVQVPVYFTVQPAGGHIADGYAAIDYPNYRHAAPGTSVDFWHYSLHGGGWDIYGSRNDSYAPLLVQFHGNDSATKAEVSVVADDDGAPDLSAVNSLLEVTLSGEVDWGLVNLIADFARQNWGGIPYDEESGFSVTFNIEET